MRYIQYDRALDSIKSMIPRPRRCSSGIYGIAPRRHRGTLSGADLHTFPESHAAADAVGRRLRLRIVPDSVRVRLPVDDQAVVMRRTLPGADARVLAGAAKFVVKRDLGKM